MKYLDTPELWDKLVKKCYKAGVIGLDTEFYNVEIRKQSCVARSIIHVWSIAVRTKTYDPHGFHKAVGVVLPKAALEYPPIRALLASKLVIKAVHNQPVDSHSLANHGIRLRGAINTLDYARWQWPEMNRQPGYTLKSLMVTKLGREPICTFKQLCAATCTILVSRWKKVKFQTCSCGVEKCRKKKGHVKTKHEESVEVVKEKEQKYVLNLQDIVPGHFRWQLLLDYAAEDAVAALELLELCETTPDPAPYSYPTHFKGPIPPRPVYNQRVVEATIEMEACGFLVDKAFCEAMSEVAAGDERVCLDKLWEWYYFHVPRIGSHEKDRVDKVWRSPDQLQRLFDDLGVPRSPVWKKGLVRHGDYKLDGTALEWIKKSSERWRYLCGCLLELRRIWSGKKYVDKLHGFTAPDGYVHPVMGPAGDSDDAVGAVSGRNGMKNPEGQQLPKPDEDDSDDLKDLYFVRRCIIA